MGKYVMVKQVAGVVVATAMLVGCSIGEETPNNDSPVVETSHEVEAAPSQTYVTSAEKGEAQRSWPRRFFDDSSYRPGTWSTTPQGIPVYTPKNPMGELLGRPHDRDEISQCRPSAVRMPDTVRVEYIHGRLLLVSDSDGPGVVQENGLFADYAKSPVAAAMAMYNTINYVGVAPDSLGKAAVREFKENFDKDENFLEYLERDSEGMAPAWMPPAAFQVINCAGDMITIGLAFDSPADENLELTTDQIWTAHMGKLRWENGRWISQEVTQNYVYGDDPFIRSLDGWTRFEYQ